MSGSDELPSLPLIGIRMVVWYDEKLNGLTLTVIGKYFTRVETLLSYPSVGLEVDDLWASQKWSEDCQIERRHAARIARVKSLLTPHWISSFWIRPM